MENPIPHNHLGPPSKYPQTLEACRAERLRVIEYILLASDLSPPEEVLAQFQDATTRLFGLMLEERFIRTGSRFQA